MPARAAFQGFIGLTRTDCRAHPHRRFPTLSRSPPGTRLQVVAAARQITVFLGVRWVQKRPSSGADGLSRQVANGL